MTTVKVAVTVDEELLREVDRWVAAGEFPSRSRVVQRALAQLREERNKRRSLVRQLANLDPAEERALAEERLEADVAWPAY
jgi:Arc/MetJ-type ribon-helix-helix transcriptional regulator